MHFTMVTAEATGQSNLVATLQPAYVCMEASLQYISLHDRAVQQSKDCVTNLMNACEHIINPVRKN